MGAGLSLRGRLPAPWEVFFVCILDERDLLKHDEASDSEQKLWLVVVGSRLSLQDVCVAEQGQRNPWECFVPEIVCACQGNYLWPGSSQDSYLPRIENAGAPVTVGPWC